MAKGDWEDIDGSRATEIRVLGDGMAWRWHQLSIPQRSRLLKLINAHPKERDAILADTE